MNAIGYVLIFVGLVIFLVGYWFLAESQVECNDPAFISKAPTNKGGGIAGVVIGIVVIILGIVFGHSTEPMEAPTE